MRTQLDLPTAAASARRSPPRRDGALAQDARLGAGEVEHGRRRARAARRRRRPRAAPARISSGTSSSVAGPAPPWTFALVATTAPTRVERPRAAAPVSSGTRTPIVVGAAPVSHGKRRAGFGSTSVYGARQERTHDRPARRGARARARAGRRRRGRAARAAAPAGRCLQPVDLARGCLAAAGRRRGRRPCRSAARPAARRGAPRRPARSGARSDAEEGEHGLAEPLGRLDEDHVARRPAARPSSTSGIPSASSAAQAGPVMKSCSPVITSVGIVKLRQQRAQVEALEDLLVAQSRVASTQSESPSQGGEVAAARARRSRAK